MFKNIGKKLWVYKNPITHYTIQGKFSTVLAAKFAYENLLKVKKVTEVIAQNEQQK